MILSAKLLSGVIKTNLGGPKNLKTSLCLKIYLTLG